MVSPTSHFNPRSPHGERHFANIERKIDNVFQPTLPARGATRGARNHQQLHIYFNPRSPHGERRIFRLRSDTQTYNFNPRSPHGERLAVACGKNAKNLHFNPRSPHGERPWCAENAPSCVEFQPTLPARGATLSDWLLLQSNINFNPRSPHGERRFGDLQLRLALQNFNPRSPHGERPLSQGSELTQMAISTHAPRTGSDRVALKRRLELLISTHAPRTGSDRIFGHQYVRCKPISTHAPRTGSD